MTTSRRACGLALVVALAALCLLPAEASYTPVLPLVAGGSGASTAATARQNYAIDNVYLLFSPAFGDCAPASNPATFNVRNSHSLLEFDQTTAESAIYECVIPAAYDSTRNLTVTFWVTSTATTNAFVMSVAAENIGTTQDIDSDSFATAINSASTSISGTSGVPVTATVTLSNAQADAITAGQLARFQFARVPGDAGDTMAADAQVLWFVVSQFMLLAFFGRLRWTRAALEWRHAA